MKISIVTRLILKDIMMNRMLIIGSLLGALLSLYIATLSNVGFTIGGLTFITSMVAMGVFVAMFGVVRERENKSCLFVLSLPISTLQYYLVKLFAALISFSLTWGLATLATVAVILFVDSVPNGLLPFVILLMLFFFHNFAILLMVALLTKSEAWIAATIVITNTSITLFMYFLNTMPSIAENMEGPIAIWSSEIFSVIFYELAVIVGVLSLAIFMQSRRHDFV